MTTYALTVCEPCGTLLPPDATSCPVCAEAAAAFAVELAAAPVVYLTQKESTVTFASTPPTDPRCVKVELDRFRGRVPAGAVYVGCAAPHLKASPYANPFSAKRYGRDEALRLYREHLRDHPELVARARLELVGVDLACWCRPHEACHADVLLAVVAGEAP